MIILTVTEDVRTCPQCGETAGVISRRDRKCMHCGLQWTFVPPGEEDEAEELQRLNSRASAKTTRLPISGGYEE